MQGYDLTRGKDRATLIEVLREELRRTNAQMDLVAGMGMFSGDARASIEALAAVKSKTIDALNAVSRALG
jgi:hypothetical protein